MAHFDPALPNLDSPSASCHVLVFGVLGFGQGLGVQRTMEWRPFHCLDLRPAEA